MKTILLTLAVLAGCGEPPTQAELRSPIGDSTSCHRTQSPTGCGPAIACTGSLQACVDVGCAILGTPIVLYPDGSWRDPDPGPGVATILGAPGGPRVLTLGGVDAGGVTEFGQPYDFNCSPAP